MGWNRRAATARKFGGEPVDSKRVTGRTLVRENPGTTSLGTVTVDGGTYDIYGSQRVNHKGLNPPEVFPGT